MLNNKENGNAAAMRDALKLALSLLDLDKGCSYKTISQKDIDFIKSALVTTPRNCDVGTAEEQTERFLDYCLDKCDGIKCKRRLYREDEMYKCVIKWEHMPYDREDDNAQK